jgi:hypothetical protein
MWSIYECARQSMIGPADCLLPSVHGMGALKSLFFFLKLGSPDCFLPELW